MRYSKLHLIVTGVVLFIAIGSASSARAIVPLLQWDPNPEPTVAGYNVYIGNTSRNYAQVIDVGAQTALPLTNVVQGITHFIAVTAYDATHLESPFSEEIVYTPRVDGVTAATLPCTVTVSNNSKTIRFTGRVGQLCRVAASSDLRQWEEIHVAASAGFSTQFTDLSNKPARFYRVIGTPP